MNPLRNKALGLLLIAALVASCVPLAQAATTVSKKSSLKAASSKTSAKKRKVRKSSWRHRGQKQIADERTREIQRALAREGYFDGEPSGVLCARTKAALQRLQADNGWQTRIVPDSRALIKLGLGPDQSNILNPESAAVASVPSAETVGAGNQH